MLDWGLRSRRLKRTTTGGGGEVIERWKGMWAPSNRAAGVWEGKNVPDIKTGCQGADLISVIFTHSPRETRGVNSKPVKRLFHLLNELSGGILGNQGDVESIWIRQLEKTQTLYVKSSSQTELGNDSPWLFYPPHAEESSNPHPELLSISLLKPYVPSSCSQTFLIKSPWVAYLLTKPGQPPRGEGMGGLSWTPVRRLCWDLHGIVNDDEGRCLFSLSVRNVHILI